METVDFKNGDVTYADAQEAGISAGIPRQPQDAPQGAQKQSWKGYYVDPTQQPIHIVLNDAFYAAGGFAGDIDVNSEQPTKSGDEDRYSYIHPMSSEMQYRNRVKETSYYNYLARLVKSSVNPVFSRQKIETLAYIGDGENPVDDKYIKSFMRDCTGTGTSYNAVQKGAMQEQATHDVVYYAMTRRDGAELPSLSVYSAVDVIIAEGDDYGMLTSIMFNRGAKIIDEEVWETAIQFFMSDGGECKIQWWRRGQTKGDEWQKWNEEKSTGINEMIVKAHIPVAVKVGEFVPVKPTMKSILDSCLSIYQDESKVSWLYALNCLPTPVFWGDADGLFIGAGQAFKATDTNPVKGYSPAPQYMSINSANLAEAINKLKFNLERLRELAKESGIDTKTGDQAQSGYSKEFEFQATEERLRGTVARCVEMDEWVFYMFNLYMVRDSYRYERTYPNTFYPEQQPTLEDYAEWVTLANDAGLSVTRNVMIQKAVNVLLGRSATDAEYDAIREEVEKSVIQSPVIE